MLYVIALSITVITIMIYKTKSWSKINLTYNGWHDDNGRFT